MNEDLGQAVSLGQLQQPVEVVQPRVNADVTAKSHNVHSAVALLHKLNHLEEFCVLKERAVFNRHSQPDGFLGDDSAGADVLMADFAVAHCPSGQPDIAPAGMDKAV